MTSKVQNRIKRILYRPIRKKRPNQEFLSKKLEEAENVLNSTIGGIFAKRRRR